MFYTIENKVTKQQKAGTKENIDTFFVAHMGLMLLNSRVRKA